MNIIESNLKITVIGVGGAGGNIIQTLIQEQISDLNIHIVNTDMQDLTKREVENKHQLGPQTTQGFGAGADPEIGRKAFEESKATIEDIISDSNIVFTVFGLGGGTGTGAGPEIAKIAKEKGALSIVLATLPFANEGTKKQKVAIETREIIESYCDAYTLFSNQRLMEQFPDRSMEDAYYNIDNQIRKSITTITNIINVPGKNNIDFADVRSTLKNAGHTIIATGQAAGVNASANAIENATENPLFVGSISGCTKAIFNMVTNKKTALGEFDKAVDKLKSYALIDDLDTINGLTYDDNLSDEVNVSIIATGMNSDTKLEDEYEQQELAKKIEETHFATGEINIDSIANELEFEDLSTEADMFAEVEEDNDKDKSKSAIDSFDESYGGDIYEDTEELTEEVEELSDDEDVFEFED